MLKIIKNNPKKIFNLFVWLLILAILFLFNFNHYLSADEGVTLNGAWSLYQGLHIYRDFFAFIPPASFYFILCFWKIFGPSFLVAKLVSIFTIFLGAIGIYKISQKISSSKYLMLVPFLFIAIMSGSWAAINHNTFNLVAMIWALFFTIKSLDHKNRLDIIWAGLLGGLSLLFLQQKGAALLGAITLSFIIFYWQGKNKIYLQNLLKFCVTAIIPISILLLWPVKTILYDLFIFPFIGYKNANQYPLDILIVATSIWLLLLLFFAVKKERSKNIWLLIIVQLFLLATSYALPDIAHVSQIMFPASILLFVVIERTLTKSKNNQLKLLLITLIITSLLSLTILSLAFYNKFSLDSFIYKNELIEKIKAYCPNKYLYVGPFLPNLYFETGKIMATPYDTLISTQFTDQQFNEAKNFMIKNQPSCAVLVYPSYLERFHHNPNNPVEFYIRDNYQKIWDNNGAVIYKY
ncbi:MAG: glycosyltransferase family 39 protein [Candidatus Falkowbacteria bacterium]